MTRAEVLATAKPMLFNTDMVRAILDGRKTQTRRVIPRDISNWFDCDPDGTAVAYINQETGESFAPSQIAPRQPGDILYVRETWNGSAALGYWYRADEPEDADTGVLRERWRPSIHMPKQAARTFLRVKRLWPERLQDITDECAVAEGAQHAFLPSGRHAANKDKWVKGRCSDCKLFDVFSGLVVGPCSGYSKEQEARFRTVTGCTFGFSLRADTDPEPARFRFSFLWDATCGENRWRDGWDANPWVWAYEFERVVPDA